MQITVVVVDDEKFDRLSARRRLAKYPQFGEVLEFADGERFLDTCYGEGAAPAALSAGPALILMDINMPRLSGFETLLELQRRIACGFGPKTETAVLLTSSANDRDRARAADVPILRDYLTKPLTAEGVERLLALFPEVAALYPV